MADINWGSLFGPIGTFAYNYATNPNTRQDVSNITKTPLNSAAGIVGSFANLPEFGVSEAKASGDVLGTNTYDYSTAQSYPISSPSQGLPTGGSTGGTGGGGGSFDDIYNKYYQGWGRTEAERDYAANPNKFSGTQSSGPSYEDIMRSQIDSGYNSYFSELDNMLGGLDAQRQAQENIANNSFNSNVTDLGLQRTQNLNELGTQERKTEESQVKTLKDISNNIRNLMQAGNTYLGARGAGDSSAVNQYGYALTKLGSQQRGDVMGQTRQIMSDINDRKSRLDNVFMQEKNRLTVEKDNAIQGVASWFADAQNQLRQAKAQGQLAKSADLQTLTTNLYNQAVQQLANIQTQTAQRQAQLESWALNNSKSLAEAKANLAGIAQYSAPTQSFSPISGTPRFDQQGNMGVDFRGGVGTGFGLTEDQKRLLGIA